MAKKPSKLANLNIVTISLNPALLSNCKLPFVLKGSITPFKLLLLFTIEVALKPWSIL